MELIFGQSFSWLLKVVNRQDLNYKNKRQIPSYG
jgi:hypothetical protein